MAKIRLVVKKNKKHAKTVTVYLSIAHDYRRSLVALDCTIKPSQWNASAEEVRKGPDSKQLNSYLQGAKADAQSIVAEMLAAGSIITPDRIKARLIERLRDDDVANRSEDFLDFCDRYIAGYEQRGQYGTHKHYTSQLNKLRRFREETAGRKRIEWDEIDVRLVEEYETWLTGTLGNGQNTVHKNLSWLRTMIRAAIRQDLLPVERNPFLKKRRLKRATATKKHLKKVQVDKLAEIELSAGSMMAIARDMWLFAFYTCGTRISDVLTLTPADVATGRVVYDMRKVGKNHSVPIPKPAQEILHRYTDSDQMRHRKYIFPLIDEYAPKTDKELYDAIGKATARVNRALSRVTAKAGIEQKLTSHLARHSFARYLVESDFDIFRIKEALNHSSVAMTEEYLRGFDRNTLDADLLSLLNA